ncbi:hypothetical protein LIER_36963 [Lithospermum erythrorhizon]|uniref:Reverse transcriptase domain-containing protein n=1 Tax=Lithospermum erythrorhizon TaxID=34254 RepID=A0AAV3PDD6_LITER
MADYMPISLCNVIYKIASKILVNRLKPHMNSLISPFQNGFVHDRGIQDNIIMVQELTHTIRTSKSKKDGMAVVKIDMSNAFDRIKWDFLLKLLETIGAYFRSFKPYCGLRQVDPLSPILFALCTKVLSSTLQQHQDRGNLEGVFISRNRPQISHLLFVGDIYFFLKLDSKSLSSFHDSLKSFHDDSCQIIDLRKSIITFSPFTLITKKSLALSTLGISESHNFDSYLGDKHSASSSWKSLHSGLESISNNMIHKVGMGYSINIWEDYWIPGVNPDEFKTVSNYYPDTNHPIFISEFLMENIF